MNLIELTYLIHVADRRQGGCSVEFTTRNAPGSSKGAMFGIVKTENTQRTFHDEDELRDILERLGKR